MKRTLTLAAAIWVLTIGTQIRAQNLVQNGSFDVGTWEDPMTDQSGPPWHVAYGTPQIREGTGCDKGQLQMWGNVSDGESIYQTLTTPIKKGHTYQLSACISFWHDNPDNYTNYVRVRFSAADANSVPVAPNWPTDKVTGEEIGHVQTSDQAYVTYSLPLWTASNDYVNFGVDVEDDNDGTNSATWGHIDQITLTECTTGGGVEIPQTQLRFNVPSCGRIDSAVIVSFKTCKPDTAMLESVTLRGSKSFQLVPSGQLPRPIANESIRFTFDAAASGGDTGYVDLVYQLDGATHDTTVTIVAHRGTSYGANSYADGTLHVSQSGTVTVPVRVALPNTFITSGLAVHSVGYLLAFDSMSLGIPPSQLPAAIVPSAGWTLGNWSVGSSEVSVQLTNSTNAPIRDSLDLGSVTFTEQPTATNSSLVFTRAVQIQTDTGYLGFCFFSEGDYLANVVPLQRGVTAEATPESIDLRLYPNPVGVGDALRALFTLKQTAYCEVSVTDLLGSTKYRQGFGRLNAGDHALPIQLPSLAAGDYYVRVSLGAFVQTSKITIVR